MTDNQRPYVPARTLNTDYPVSIDVALLGDSILIDLGSLLIVTRLFARTSWKTLLALRHDDSHIKRVLRYARPSDYLAGAGLAALGPSTMLIWEQVAPSYVGRGGFASIMRLSVACGAVGGFLMFYSRSTSRPTLSMPFDGLPHYCLGF